MPAAAARPPRILIFGTGSIGAVYAWVLSRAVGESNIFAVCRSNYDIARRQGFTINSALFGENLNVRPVVVKSAAEAAAAVSSDDEHSFFDYVVVTAKAIPSTPSIPSQIQDAVGPETSVVLIQNGIGVEEIYRTAFPYNPILSCVVYLPATQISPGVITHAEVEHLHIGTFPSTAPRSHKAGAQAFTDLIQSEPVNATATLHDDIQEERWTKLLVNASWNPICALSRSRDAQFLSSSPIAPSIVRSVMLEVASIARAAGYPDVSPERAEHQLGRAQARTLPGVEPSMQADALAGRRLEVDAIVGNALLIAEDKGVATPLLSLLYALANALDQRAQL
ncbi:2-dehydropantoate 2-reductase [Exophiala aquamarina CBS 119918]|uniref:2-dehydropantoate 2-reductase n=1 Tax=Exophiala aquamarina CBS 119918 TaxID=1182545 RepID=A0A072PWF1_9EURO|nr:2-dehydropantoate 2-reductase [Exophiala aquamarina CBS 119918]KEF59910.1 2-dehydropantoate 2-reductase [Exophiala aquamarina CBS 119918]